MKMETYLIEQINNRLKDDKTTVDIILNIREYLKKFEGKKITKRALQPITDIINEAYGEKVKHVGLEKSGNCYRVRYYLKSYQEYNTLDLCLLEDREGAIEPFNMAWYDNDNQSRVKYLQDRIAKLENTEGQEKLINLVSEKARALNTLLEEFRSINSDDLMEPWKYVADDCVNLSSMSRERYFELV